MAGRWTSISLVSNYFVYLIHDMYVNNAIYVHMGELSFQIDMTEKLFFMFPSKGSFV
jgi:hypothetical protein